MVFVWRSDRKPHTLIHEALQQGLSEGQCAEALSDWASSQFGMTASHPAGNDNMGLPCKNKWPPPEGTAPPPAEEDNPLAKMLMDISDTQETILQDHLLLTNRVNIHRCSNYCLQNKIRSETMQNGIWY